MEFGLLTEAWEWIKSHPAEDIAILAFVATGLQAYFSRQHNRVSVRPYLFVSTTYLAPSGGAGGVQYEAKLMNGGLGPAFIHSYSILINGVEHQIKRPEELKALVEGIAERPATDWYFWIYHPNSVMRPQDEILIGKVTFNSRSIQEALDLSEKFEDSIHVLVCFKSVYGEVFTYDSREHKTKVHGKVSRALIWLDSIVACK